MKRFITILLVVGFLFPVLSWAGDGLEAKIEQREDLAKDIQIIRLKRERDEALFQLVRERDPRHMRELKVLGEQMRSLKKEIKELEEAGNEKDKSATESTDNPGPVVPNE